MTHTKYIIIAHESGRLVFSGATGRHSIDMTLDEPTPLAKRAAAHADGFACNNEFSQADRKVIEGLAIEVCWAPSGFRAALVRDAIGNQHTIRATNGGCERWLHGAAIKTRDVTTRTVTELVEGLVEASRYAEIALQASDEEEAAR